MADALVLAAEERPDAIVDIATLTGACMRALGTQVAGVIGQRPGPRRPGDGRRRPRPTSRSGSCRSSGATAGSSTRAVADSRTWAAPNAGAITAALFLEEFVGGCRGRTSTSPARRSRRRRVAGTRPAAPASARGCWPSSPARSAAVTADGNDPVYVSTGALPPPEVARARRRGVPALRARPHGRGVGRVPGAAHRRPGPVRHRRHGGDGRDPRRG